MIEFVSFGFKIGEAVYWWPWIYYSVCMGNAPGRHCWDWTFRETINTLSVIAPAVAMVLSLALGSWWIVDRLSKRSQPV